MFCLVVNVFSQENEVIFTVDNEPVRASEFKRVYEKNLELIQDDDSKNIDNYLDLYANYKLRIKQAYKLRLDTLRTYKREIAKYRNELSAPYLQDEKLLEELTKQAYYRTKNEIKAKHILVRFPKNMNKKDTLQYYQKIVSYRNRVLSGEPFEKVAFEVSEDPSAKKNNGNLGYFSAFKMVFPFEDAAYKTKLGEVSKPFKTRFGYHILKVDAIRESKGEFSVAHIVNNDKSIVGKNKMDEVYAKLQNGAKFEDLAKKYSEDRGSAEKGGKLDRFGTGATVAEFENAVLSLEKAGDYTKPFRTKYGWHIVKLLKNFPVLSYERMRNSLLRKVKSGGRAKSSSNSVINKLKKEYSITVNDAALAQFTKENKRFFPKAEMQKTILTINDKQIKQEKFSRFIVHRRHLTIKELLPKFIDEEVVTYYKENLEKTEPEFKNTFSEYKEGLLLFSLMQKKIWDKANKDTLGLQTFFDKQQQFKGKKLADVKGQAISAYQEFLEKEWTKDLRKDANIQINKDALRRFKKKYNQ